VYDAVRLDFVCTGNNKKTLGLKKTKTALIKKRAEGRKTRTGQAVKTIRYKAGLTGMNRQ